jgi:hypothetical protein
MALAYNGSFLEKCELVWLENYWVYWFYLSSFPLQIFWKKNAWFVRYGQINFCLVSKLNKVSQVYTNGHPGLILGLNWVLKKWCVFHHLSFFLNFIFLFWQKKCIIVQKYWILVYLCTVVKKHKTALKTCSHIPSCAFLENFVQMELKTLHSAQNPCLIFSLFGLSCMKMKCNKFPWSIFHCSKISMLSFWFD